MIVDLGGLSSCLLLFFMENYINASKTAEILK